MIHQIRWARHDILLVPKRTLAVYADLMPPEVEMRVQSILRAATAEGDIWLRVGDGLLDVTERDLEAIVTALDDVPPRPVAA